jgi:hypothetical protein
MSDDMIEKLEKQLRVPLSGPVVRAAQRMASEAEQARTPIRVHRRRAAIAVIAATLIGFGGGAVAYAAPQTWMWLFPADIPKSFTFPSGRTCTVDLRVRADYSVGDPNPAAIAIIERAARDLDVSKLNVLSYIGEATPKDLSLIDKVPDLVEREALRLAVQDQMMTLTGGPNGATWSSSTSCD